MMSWELAWALALELQADSHMGTGGDDSTADHRHIAQDDNLEGEEEKAVEVAEAGGVEDGEG